MIVKKLILSFIFLFALAVHVYAVVEASDGGEVSDFNALTLYKRSKFLIGFEVINYLYKEPGLMKLTGTKQGLFIEWVERKDNWFSALQFRFMTGEVDYDGALMDGTKYKYNGHPDHYFECKGLAGFVIPALNDCLEYRPYCGLGYRCLINKRGDDPRGYDRESQYLYLPMGVNVKYKCKKELTFDICGEFGLLLFGIQKSDFKEIIGEIIENKQNKGYGLRLSCKISKVVKKTTFFIGPFIRYWNIDKSDEVPIKILLVNGELVDGKSYEPKNYTLESGVQLGVSF
ncbi:MAG: hypothetical protein LBT18_01345 [Endomicrobium sp.]|jgi:hypothetical protein|nr:hypothetical protein [Endomicrobium sp.]